MRKYHQHLIALIVIILAFYALPVAAQEQPPDRLSPLTPKEARQLAWVRLKTQVEHGYIPEWHNATLADPVTLYDLSGEVSAYLFPVAKGAQNIGYITTLAFDLPNPVVEFSTSTPPLSVRQMDVQGIRETADKTVCLTHPLYVGPLSYGYELADPGACDHTENASERYVIDLSTQQVLNINASQAIKPLREWIKTSTSHVPVHNTTIMAYKLISNVPDYCQFQTNGCWSGCVPTAIANILGYWDAHGYPNLQSGDNWQQLVLDLGSRMNTRCGSTSIGDSSPGLISYAQAKGYYFESYLDYPGAAYSLLRGEIDANRPIAVDIIGAAEYWNANHTVTGVGYQTDGTYMIVHDALSCGINQGNHYIHYGSGWYSSIGMHPVGPDTTPPTKAANVRPDGWTGRYTNDSTPRFRWDRASDTSGINGYYVAVDDWTPEGSAANDWWAGNVTSFTIPEALPDGEHHVAVTSRDNAGNVNPANTNQQGDAPYYTFYVDTQAPSAPTSVDPGCDAQDDVWQQTCTNPTFTWAGASDHGGSGIKDYHIYWGPDPSGSPTLWRSNSRYDPGPITISDDVAVHYLRVAPRDNLGQEASPVTIFTLRYDNYAPSGNPGLQGGVDTAHTTDVLLALNGQDTGSGLRNVYITNDGQNWQRKDYAPTLLWSLRPQNRTLHTVQVQFEDVAGNTSPIYPCQICLDLYPAHPASTHHRLWSAGPTAAGGVVTSNHYRLTHTIGEPTSGGPLSSTSYRLQSGFQGMWPATPGDPMFTAFRCEYTLYLPIIIHEE